MDDTLLKIKVLHSDVIEEPFLVPQRSIQSKNISFLPFYNLKNLLSAQRTHIGSSDVKGSSVALEDVESF